MGAASHGRGFSETQFPTKLFGGGGGGRCGVDLSSSVSGFGQYCPSASRGRPRAGFGILQSYLKTPFLQASILRATKEMWAPCKTRMESNVGACCVDHPSTHPQLACAIEPPSLCPDPPCRQFLRAGHCLAPTTSAPKNSQPHPNSPNPGTYTPRKILN